MTDARVGSIETPRGPLTRERVIDSAVPMFAAADDVSIRDLARGLGVSPMALYRHVENKQDLLEAVVDRLLADVWEPAGERTDWQAWTIDAADRLRAFLLDRPAALAVYLRRPVRTPVAMRRMTACLEVLERALGDSARAHSAYASLHSYTVGFAALEASREASPPPVADGDAVLDELVALSSPAQFRAGLMFLLSGVEQSATST